MIEDRREGNDQRKEGRRGNTHSADLPLEIHECLNQVELLLGLAKSLFQNQCQSGGHTHRVQRTVIWVH